VPMWVVLERTPRVGGGQEERGQTGDIAHRNAAAMEVGQWGWGHHRRRWYHTKTNPSHFFFLL
jgi:hypothetical protein